MLILIGTIPFIAFAQKAGTTVIQGGTGGWGSFPLFRTGSVTNTISFYGWGGLFVSNGFEIGPYVSIDYTGTQDQSAKTGSSTFYLDPGVQTGIFLDNGDITIVLRATAVVQFQFDSTTSAGSTSSDFSVPGLWVEITPQLAMKLNPQAAFTVGPYFNAWKSLTSSWLGFTAGFNIGFLVYL
jgi:hypothetical protein